MSRTLPAITLALALATASSSAAAQTVAPDRPWTGYLEVDAPVDQAINSNIIYLNPCWGGCTVSGPYQDNSITNHSSIVSGTRTLSQFNAGQSAWNAVVQCVKAQYEPFGVTVTTTDPSPSNHWEAMVAGSPTQIGQPSGVGGVSPWNCGIINNAITFTFANVYGGSVEQICETVAQETAHAFGLDHEFYCPDNMTYRYGCGNKSFVDYNAQCGEDRARQCSCGGASQNSYRKILNIFGPGTPTPPTVTITAPADGSRVDAGYVVRADITDDVSVTSADLYINSLKVSHLTQPPWIFNAPADLSDGVHQVEVRAYDNRDTPGSGIIHVTQGDPCGGPGDCAAGETCIEGRCVPGPDTAGGLGTPCTTSMDCLSGLCPSDGTDSYCAETCNSTCPDGFGCIDAGDINICWPGAENPASGGCRSHDGDRPIWLGLLIGGLLLLARRRR